MFLRCEIVDLVSYSVAPEPKMPIYFMAWIVVFITIFLLRSQTELHLKEVLDWKQKLFAIL